MYEIEVLRNSRAQTEGGVSVGTQVKVENVKILQILGGFLSDKR